MGNRKRFGLIRFYDVKEIKEEPLMEIIHEAIMVDEEVWKKKISAARIRPPEKIKSISRGIREK